MKKKVAVCIPCQDTVKAKTAFSLIHALHNVDFEYDLCVRIGCDLIGSREGLVRQAIKTGATHMLFVDHDMHFLPINNKSPVQILLDRNKDIIGASYNFRSLPLKSTAIPLSDISDKTQPYRCQTIGTGFMLIKLSVFDKIAKPYFNFGRNSEAEMVYGEDTWFCQQAIKAGFDIWADPTLKVQHIGEFLY